MSRSPFQRLTRFTCLLCCAAWCILPARASQLDPDELINLELKQADLVETLKSFAQISGSYLDIEPAIRGQVTLHIEATRWTDAMDQVCDDHQLNCEILNGEPSVLRVRSTADAKGAASIPGYVEAISLSLKDADLRETLKVFAVITQRDVVVDDGVSGSVTINIGAAPWAVILEEICNLSGCEIEWGSTLHIRPAASSGARRANLRMTDASVGEAVTTLARMPIFGSLGRPEVKLAEDLTSKVSLELDNANWLEAMNRLCDAADCIWTLTYGSPTQIDIKPIDQSPEREVELPAEPMALREAADVLARILGLEVEIRKGFDPDTRVSFPASPAIWREAASEVCKQADCVWGTHDKTVTLSPRVKTLTDRPSVGARDQKVAVRFLPPAASLPIEGAIRFNWTAPTHTLDAGGDDRWMARLSWIPFGPELHMVAPTIIHCRPGGETTSQLLDLVRVPVETPQSRQWRGSMVDLSNPDDNTPALSHTRGVSDCASTPKGFVEATFHRAGSNRAISTLDLQARIGNYLLITPPSGEKRPAPMAALMALGVGAIGQQRIALLRPSTDGANVEVEVLEIPPSGEVMAELKAPDGNTFELVMRFVTKE